MGAWGDSLFQSDHDFDMISELGAEAGLHKLMEDHFTRVKEEGDTNARKSSTIPSTKAEMLGPPSDSRFFRDPCYAYVLLRACAMSLACTLPLDYLETLKKVNTEGGLMPGALKQMHKAFHGPDGFINDVPYDFQSKCILETAMAKGDRNQTSAGDFRSLNVLGPGSFFNTGMGDSSSSTIIKELREQHSQPESCGGWGVKTQLSGEVHMQCAKCRFRKYCSRECQKKHWKFHKKICDPALG